MNHYERLSLLWSQFDLAWSYYLHDYERRIQSIADLHKLVETFDSDSEEAKAIKLKIMEQSDPEREQINPPELTLKAYLTLAKKLNYHDKSPTIKERLQRFYQNINTLLSLQDELDNRFNMFMKRQLTKE